MSRTTASYYKLEPHTAPSPDAILSASIGLWRAAARSAVSNDRLYGAAASAAIELMQRGIASDAYPRAKWAEIAKIALSSTRYLNSSRLLSLYMPLFTQGPTPEALRQTGDSLPAFVDDLRANFKTTFVEPPGFEREPIRYARKAAVLGLLCGVPGLVAHPSYDRQEKSDFRIDGKRVCWDITAESDGTTLAAGQYHIQTMSPNSPAPGSFHHSIRLVSDRILGRDPDDPQSMFTLARDIAQANLEPSEDISAIAVVRDAVLGRLERARSSSPMVYF